ncbi:MAG TPA: hypothetical protein VHQ87_18785 [Rhizobacter sp.]|nr:hypothetical protein [Rhizobacter sp.]
MTTASRRDASVNWLWGLAGCAALGLAGCATTRIDAQWTDPALSANNPLRGARVLVVCEAPDLVLRRVCQDEMGNQVAAVGATPVAAPDVPADGPLTTARYVEAAKTASAKAVLVAAITQSSTVVSPGFSIGVGLGGWGSSGAGGVGVSAPVGGGAVSNGYAANGTITDAASGRVMWTGRASAPPSNNVNGQMAELARVVVSTAAQAGLF